MNNGNNHQLTALMFQSDHCAQSSLVNSLWFITTSLPLWKYWNKLPCYHGMIVKHRSAGCDLDLAFCNDQQSTLHRAPSTVCSFGAALWVCRVYFTGLLPLCWFVRGKKAFSVISLVSALCEPQCEGAELLQNHVLVYHKLPFAKGQTVPNVERGDGEVWCQQLSSACSVSPQYGEEKGSHAALVE